MDWADDVAYSVHDLEDGLNAGLITFAQLHDPAERAVVAEVALSWYLDPGVGVGGRADHRVRRPDDPGLLAQDLRRRPRRPGRPEEPDQRAGRPLLRRRPRFHPGPVRAPAPCQRYACNLEVPRRQRLECALLKGVAAHYVMTREGAAALQARERELIAELAATIQIGAPNTLDPLFRPAWESADSDPAKRRVVIDQVASLTDTSARAWHHHLTHPTS